MEKILNLNIGVLGHVDSGKTSLAKVLSTKASTAAFDKNPQSQERGITIDLGFSSLIVDLPETLRDSSGAEKLQFTLVDCPGHASLIRTIIGGAQIIDMMILVIDVTKGMQTQTAECLIIGELSCDKMIVVLNKIDMLPSDKKEAMIQKMIKKMKLTLSNTIFKDCPIVSTAARPGGGEETKDKPQGIEELIKTLQQSAFIPNRKVSLPFLFSVDHCFSIRGQGTVMTGTVLRGAIAVNDTIEIPALKTSKKVKSLQMFREPVNNAGPGDRLGICVTQFDPKLVERGLLCAPGYISSISAAIISINKIKYFKGAIKTKASFHISMGHETIMAKITLFGLMLCDCPDGDASLFDFNKIYKYFDELLVDDNESSNNMPIRWYGLLEFEKPVMAVPNCLVIGSKLDIDIHTTTCRLAFHGQLLQGFEDKNYMTTMLPKLKIYKEKSKQGMIERIVNEYEVIAKNLFKKETNTQLFVGLKVKFSTGEQGVIDNLFGQSGKVKIRVPGGLNESTMSHLSTTKKKDRGKTAPSEVEVVQVVLCFKKFIFDSQKKIVQ